MSPIEMGILEEIGTTLFKGPVIDTKANCTFSSIFTKYFDLHCPIF